FSPPPPNSNTQLDKEQIDLIKNSIFSMPFCQNGECGVFSWTVEVRHGVPSGWANIKLSYTGRTILFDGTLSKDKPEVPVKLYMCGATVEGKLSFAYEGSRIKVTLKAKHTIVCLPPIVTMYDLILAEY
ncbi:MAG: hypothetical protein FWG55_00135, partial [Candidatus Bathyarchaeota archaeon]|nr:hypothetical protein [Candidatus Termiticorpusculum sp.]